MTKPFGPHRRLQVEPLEDRSLPSSGITSTLQNGVLTIVGTDAADTIVIRQTPQGVTVNGQRSFANVARVVVDGRGGNDRIYVDTSGITGTGRAPISAYLIGGPGNDLLVGGDGNDTLIGGDGADSIYGAGGNDYIEGNAGADRLFGNAGNDIIYGGDGEDVIVGGTGNDFIDGGAGGDWLYGGEGNDTILGGAGNDYLEGDGGDDKLYGEGGNDWLVGGAGNDLLSGGADQDFLDGGPGNDTFDGGAGFDSFHRDVSDVLTNPSEVNDIRQGASGTCVVLASLSAIANSGVDLAGRIQQVGENQYNVPLYRPGTGWVTQTVYFDGTWTDNDPSVANPGDAWVCIYQRAFLQEMGVRWTDPNQAQWANTYGDRFQHADAALVAFTGSASWHDSAMGLARTNLSDLTRAVAGQRPTIALTRDADIQQYGLIADHAYTVLGVSSDASGTKVILRNPWGSDGPQQQGANDGVIALRWDVFARVMQGFCVA
jgi:hypothetical protein